MSTTWDKTLARGLASGSRSEIRPASEADRCDFAAGRPYFSDPAVERQTVP